MDVLQKLRELERLPAGSPPPEWLDGWNWAASISQLCKEAGDEIDILYSDADIDP